MTLYKITMPGGTPTHQHDFRWPRPYRTKSGREMPGKWVVSAGDVKLCENGFHLTTKPFMWYTKMDVVCWEAEGRGDRDGDGSSPDGKIAFREARLLRPVHHPQWWEDAKAFIGSIPAVPFFQKQGDPDPAWKVFPTRDAAGSAAGDTARSAARSAARDAARDTARDTARDAARDSAENAAGDAAWDSAGDAAGDAALLGSCITAYDQQRMESHLAYARKRWDVWLRGYGLLRDVDGAFYVYEKP